MNHNALFTLEERLKMAASSRAASPEAAAGLVQRIFKTPMEDFFSGKDNLDRMNVKIGKFMNPLDEKSLYYGGFCHSLRLAVESKWSATVRSAEPQDSFMRLPTAGWDSTTQDAIALLGRLLLDHADGKMAHKGICHCMRMTLGQYMDALVDISFREDGTFDQNRSEFWQIYRGMFLENYDGSAPLGEVLRGILDRYAVAWNECDHLCDLPFCEDEFADALRRVNEAAADMYVLWVQPYLRMGEYHYERHLEEQERQTDIWSNQINQINQEGKSMNNNVKTKRILAKDTFASNDTWATGINNNDLLVGPSGGGKTRGYVTPNILHAQDSLIVADTKGNLHRLYGDYLKRRGYKVMHLNFTDVADTTWGYNPLDYVRRCQNAELNRNGDYYSEQDVKKLAKALCPCEDRTQPFWDLAAQMYLEAIILFVLNLLPQEQHNLYEVFTFLSRMGSKELESMIGEECVTHPNSAFARKIRMIGQNTKAEKMDASIKGILAQHLDVVSYSGAKRMFCMEQQVDMGSFLKGKTALFLSVSDSDRSQDSVVNLFYTQALQYLMAAADRQPDSRLPIPVRFILDDFSTNTVIPDFDKIISVLRSREIYVSLVIQSLSQLEGLYGHAKAQTIINNCDHCLYLGGMDIQTARYFAEKFNCHVSTVLNLPLDFLFLFERGRAPRKVRKYELDKDEVYRSVHCGLSSQGPTWEPCIA